MNNETTETIFANKEKITVAETSIATVTAVITDNWFYWKWDDAVIKSFENSTSDSNSGGVNVKTATTSINSTLENFSSTFNGWNIFSNYFGEVLPF